MGWQGRATDQARRRVLCRLQQSRSSEVSMRVAGVIYLFIYLTLSEKERAPWWQANYMLAVPGIIYFYSFIFLK